MVKRGGKGLCRPVETLPANFGRKYPSTNRRNLWSTRNLFKHACLAFAAFIFTASTTHGLGGGAAAAMGEAASKLEEVGDPALALRQILHASESSRNVRDRRLQGLPDQCIDSPLWEKEVDSANYMFGCAEVEDMLQGSKTHVGSGLVRDVYLTKYRDTTVVLKVLREQADPRTRNAVLELHKREALTLDAVTGHPNIVGMLGICNTTLVTEYHPTSLVQVMWNNRDTFTIDKVVSMALDAAKGLQALHEASIAPIVHFDMKPQQLLIDEDGRVMLNDFNLAQFMGTRQSGVSCPFETDGGCPVVPWRAPENIAGKPLTEKIDIYSMGMIFFSLVSGKLPFPRSERGSQMILQGERPEIDPSLHSGFMQVVQSMWQQEPTDRPSARQVVARLEAILDSLSA